MKPKTVKQNYILSSAFRVVSAFPHASTHLRTHTFLILKHAIHLKKKKPNLLKHAQTLGKSQDLSTK